jgi:hypothetical protein
MSTKFAATGTQIVASMAVGAGPSAPVSAPAGNADAGVSGAAVTLQGSMDNITFVLLISWTNGLTGPGPGATLASQGTGTATWSLRDMRAPGMTAEIDTFDGVSAGSAHGGAGMW